jgi:hypothetical protein
MKTLNWYIDTAKERSGHTSDWALARELRTVRQQVRQWRFHETFPGDEYMLRLAELAGVDPITALMDLNAWRCERAGHDRARAYYLRVADALAAKSAEMEQV